MATSTYTTTLNGQTVNISYTVPALTDTANIQDALDDLTTSIFDAIKPFLTNNVVPSSNTNGKVTVTNTTADTYAAGGRIFVQSTEPANKAIGDVWMW